MKAAKELKINSVAGTRIEQDNSNTIVENEAIEGAPIGPVEFVHYKHNGKVNTIAFNPNSPKRNKQLISNIKLYGRVETQTLFPFIICTYLYENKKGIGISRCSESDKWNESEGIKKATGRALRALVCKLECRPFPQNEKKYMG